MVRGGEVKLTTDNAFAEKGNEKIVFVDYVNITKVVKPGNRVFVDDGLISLVVKEVGKSIDKQLSCSNCLSLCKHWIKIYFA